jgi:hypothetical protein
VRARACARIRGPLEGTGCAAEWVYLRQHRSDPAFLGIVNPENDAVYLPLKEGRKELMLAVSELGGGWGFIARLADPQN